MIHIRIPQGELRHVLSAFDAVPWWPGQAAAKGVVKPIIKTPNGSYQSDRPRHNSLSLSCISGAALLRPAYEKHGMACGADLGDRPVHRLDGAKHLAFRHAHQTPETRNRGRNRQAQVGGVHGRFVETETAVG
jgi:hypothetical protein